MDSMKSRFHKKALAVGLASALSLAAGVSAFAYWTATGSGTGTASTLSGSGADITQTSVINDLEPGNTTPDVIYGDVSVGGGEEAYVSTITPVVIGTSNPGCTSDDFIVTPSAIDQQISGTATGVVLGTIVFNDTNANQDACKNATVNLQYSMLSGVSNATLESALNNAQTAARDDVVANSGGIYGSLASVQTAIKAAYPSMSVVLNGSSTLSEGQVTVIDAADQTRVLGNYSKLVNTGQGGCIGHTVNSDPSSPTNNWFVGPAQTNCSTAYADQIGAGPHETVTTTAP